MSLLSLLCGCTALKPRDQTLDQRLASLGELARRTPESTLACERLERLLVPGLPIAQPVTVRWNEQQIPWIQAGTDGDLAFVLGLVHAHLRLGQMAVLKRVAQGRLSEMAGPLAQNIDHALRILDYGRAAPAIIAAWPDETRLWMQAFADGLNYYQDHMEVRPPEYALLGLEHERWTLEDLVLLGRLTGTDVNWLTYFDLLPLRSRPDWPEIWKTATTLGSTSGAGSALKGRVTEEAALATLLTRLNKAGSNSIVIAPERSATGSALIANDPHLGLSLPNFWLIVGMQSPSYHAVGLMIPGVPFVAVGRNPDLAWGGTNLRATVTEIFDVSGEPPETITTEQVEIGTRFWPDSQRQRRWSRYGPIISDSSLLPAQPGETLALKWVGHEPTDEISAFLRANRARNGEEFRAAFAGFGVPPQNMLFADRQGNIGKIFATSVPNRESPIPDDLVQPPCSGCSDWDHLHDATDLPMLSNPVEGYLASANNRPPPGVPSLGYLFGPEDRVERLHELMGEHQLVGLDDLRRFHQDITSTVAQRLASDLVAEARRVQARPVSLLDRMAGWDGRYAAESPEPPAFELLLYHTAHLLYGSGDGGVNGLQGEWSYLTRYLLPDLQALEPPARRQILSRALQRASDEVGRFPTWGDMHRLRVGHMLSGIPVLGRAFVEAVVPAAGSRETLQKSAHGLVRDVHEAEYGAQARHISDLADEDANWFAILGGQDGWLGSANFVDQLPMWFRGEYVRVPLRPETVEREFTRVTTFQP